MCHNYINLSIKQSSERVEEEEEEERGGETVFCFSINTLTYHIHVQTDYQVQTTLGYNFKYVNEYSVFLVKDYFDKSNGIILCLFEIF